MQLRTGLEMISTMTKQQKIINIAHDFAAEPYGRYLEDGDTNGTRFREDFLVPALNSKEQIIIVLDSTEGYGSSFLDEAFGGLVRINGFEPNELHEKIEFISEDDPSLITEIWEYIDTTKIGKKA